MNATIVLKTKRLHLRFFNEADIDDLQLLFSDPVAMQYFPSVKTDEETRGWVQTNIRNYDLYGFGLYACIRKEDNRLVGYCGFIPQEDVNGRNEVEIGYGLIRSYWGHGYAIEAAMACKKYGFETLHCQQLISLIRPENTASIKVALRNGMKWETDIFRWNFRHCVYNIKQK